MAENVSLGLLRRRQVIVVWCPVDEYQPEWPNEHTRFRMAAVCATTVRPRAALYLRSFSFES